MRSCCATGVCATHLSEQHPAGESHSTIHLGSSVALAPNFGSQELAASMAREAYFLGLRVLGLEPEAFV